MEDELLPVELKIGEKTPVLNQENVGKFSGGKLSSKLVRKN